MQTRIIPVSESGNICCFCKSGLADGAFLSILDPCGTARRVISTASNFELGHDRVKTAKQNTTVALLRLVLYVLYISISQVDETYGPSNIDEAARSLRTFVPSPFCCIFIVMARLNPAACTATLLTTSTSNWKVRLHHELIICLRDGNAVMF